MRDFGGLAQLGERLPCKQEVSGSIPLISTKSLSKIKSKPSGSGFDLKRRRSGMNEFSMEIGNEGYETCVDDGPVAQLARAYD